MKQEILRRLYELALLIEYIVHKHPMPSAIFCTGGLGVVLILVIDLLDTEEGFRWPLPDWDFYATGTDRHTVWDTLVIAINMIVIEIVCNGLFDHFNPQMGRYHIGNVAFVWQLLVLGTICLKPHSKAVYCTLPFFLAMYAMAIIILASLAS